MGGSATDAGTRGMDPESWLQVGQCHLRGKRWFEAADAFRETVRLHPRSVRGWLGLGKACYQLHQLDQAAVAFSIVVRRLEPQTAIAWEHLAHIYQERACAAHEGPGFARDKARQWHLLARHALRRHLDLRPEVTDSWFCLGITYMSLGQSQLPHAAEAFMEAIHREPDRTSAWYCLGLVHAVMEDREATLGVYRHLENTSPGLAARLLAEVRSLAEPRDEGGRDRPLGPR